MTLIEILIMYFVLTVTSITVGLIIVACNEDMDKEYAGLTLFLLFIMIPLNIVVFY